MVGANGDGDARVGPGGRWVVGVDGSPSSIAALGWAMANAPRCGALAVALHVHEPGTSASDALRIVDIALDAVDGIVGAPVDRCVVRGSPKRALIAAAGTAALLVVGRDGSGRSWPHPPGSIARHCVLRAAVPVAVVPPSVAPAPAERVLVPDGTLDPALTAWVERLAAGDRVVPTPVGIAVGAGGRSPTVRDGLAAVAALTDSATPRDVLVVPTVEAGGGRSVLGATATWMLDVAEGVVIFLPG
jgi:nucleotide-binding universal stress UspA family protein